MAPGSWILEAKIQGAPCLKRLSHICGDGWGVHLGSQDRRCPLLKKTLAYMWGWWIVHLGRFVTLRENAGGKLHASCTLRENCSGKQILDPAVAHTRPPSIYGLLAFGNNLWKQKIHRLFCGCSAGLIFDEIIDQSMDFGGVLAEFWFLISS